MAVIQLTEGELEAVSGGGGLDIRVRRVNVQVSGGNRVRSNKNDADVKGDFSTNTGGVVIDASSGNSNDGSFNNG